MLDPPLLSAQNLVLALLRPQQILELDPTGRHLVSVVLLLILFVAIGTSEHGF